MSKVSYKNLLLKKNKSPITCLTAYSKPIANLLDGKVDLILVGDSVGTTLYGMKNTRGVTLEMMKNHGMAVVRNTKYSMSIIDMPYNTYRNKKEALKNANELIAFTKADFLKIETDKKNIEIVKYLSDNKIKVVSHIGVTPQKFSDFKKNCLNFGRKELKKQNSLFQKFVSLRPTRDSQKKIVQEYYCQTKRFYNSSLPYIARLLNNS